MINRIILSQIEAALATLKQPLENCPEGEWNESHGDSPFCQVVFHTLFYTDVYLGRDGLDIKDQPFHRENRDFFRDYEEAEDRLPVNLYDRGKCWEYMAFCLEKAGTVLKGETDESLLGGSRISWKKKLSRLELYIYLIRHIQHHAAQLGLRVQGLTGKELDWVSAGGEKSGW